MANQNQQSSALAQTQATCNCGTSVGVCPVHSFTTSAITSTWNYPTTTTGTATWAIQPGQVVQHNPAVYMTYAQPSLFPWHIEEVEISEEGMVSVYGSGRLLLGTMTAKALRRLIDVCVLDAFR